MNGAHAIQMDQLNQQQLNQIAMSHQMNSAAVRNAYEKNSRSAAAAAAIAAGANGTPASYFTSEFLSDDDNTEKMINNVNYNQAMAENMIRTTVNNAHAFGEALHHAEQHQLQVKQNEQSICNQHGTNRTFGIRAVRNYMRVALDTACVRCAHRVRS